VPRHDAEADYQYDITYGYVSALEVFAAISSWLSTAFSRKAIKALKLLWGMFPDLFCLLPNGDDFSGGNIAFSFSHDFSHTYEDIRHMASLPNRKSLLKPFEQRVLGTYVFLEPSNSFAGRIHLRVTGRQLNLTQSTERKYSG